MINPVAVEVYLKCCANPVFKLRHMPFVIDMERTLGALPWQKRKLLLLIAEGYTKVEIANIMYWPITTAQRRINHARNTYYGWDSSA